VQGKSNRFASQGNKRRGRPRRATKGQLQLIRHLRREAGLPPLQRMPTRWATAVHQIDRLKVKAGKTPDPNVKRPEPKALTNAQLVKLSIQRDLARTRERESVADEQARLKLEAAARRARAAASSQPKTDYASAAD
jgi:hypothetical protein